MRTSRSTFRKAALRTGGLFFFFLVISCSGPSSDEPDESPPLAGTFIQNEGQVGDSKIVLYHTSHRMAAGFLESAILIKLVEPSTEEAGEGIAEVTSPPALDDTEVTRGVQFELSFPGSHRVRPEGRGEIGYPTHYLSGSDPAGWQIDVARYREVVYPDLYDGIDLVYKAGAEGLKYEFHVRPGADPTRIEVAYDGIDGLDLGQQGDLLVHTSLGDVRDSVPVTYTTTTEGASSDGSASSEKPLESRYVLKSPLSFGFEVSGWDGGSHLVIDPLVYSTCLGGGQTEYVRSIAVDPDGFTYLCGWTVSGDFPIARGAFRERGKGWEAFVVKMRTNGRKLVWATFLGGSGQDDAFSIKVDSDRFVYVGGYTRSLDFPVTDGSSHSGGRFDAFLTKLDPSGSSLAYSGYVGGSGDDFGCSIAIDASGFAYVAGFTYSTDFPTTPGAFQVAHRGGVLDGFVAKVDPHGGGHVWASYLGGSSIEYLWAIAVDAIGSAFVTGGTMSRDFPITPGTFNTAYRGAQDAFVVKFLPNGGGLVYGMYLGGTGFDRGFAIAVDASGYAYVGGVTKSYDFPVTTIAADSIYDGGGDGFVAALDPAGGSLAFATYLGGTGHDEIRGIAVDYIGRVVLTGFTSSLDFPVTPGALNISHNGGDDAFVTWLSPDGSFLMDSTFLGGSGLDRGFAVAARPDSDVVCVSGETRSTDFFTTDKAFQPKLSGNLDGFVVKFR
ncbi:MAG: SBBP repeat-containing protein [Planctomycetota bacterium]|nr:SBBP repeat-containing protein [Planctomycetota bacterium]